MKLCVMLAFPGLLAAGTTLDRLRACVELSDVTCASAALSAIDKQPSDVVNSLDYLELAAHALLLQGRSQEALEKIQKALSRRPEEFRYLMIQGRIHQKLGAHPSAIRSFLLAQKVQPKSPEVYFLIGMSFFIEEEYDRAWRHFQHVLKIDPSNEKAFFMLGVLHAYRNELPEAAASLAKAIALQPGNAHYLLHYGVLLDRDSKSSQALAYIRRAVELDERNPLAHYHLGRLHAERGETELARKHLERAVVLQPSLGQGYYRLAAVYRKLGLKEKAEEALMTFRKLKAKGDQSESGTDSLLLDRLPE